MSLITSYLWPVIICLVVIYLLAFIKKFIKRLVILSKLNWIPSPPALPLLGNYFDLIAPPPEVGFETMNNYFKKYGKTYKIWIGSTPVIYCQDLEIIQAIFKTDDHVSRPDMYKMIGTFIGPGLLFGEGGETWKQARRYLLDSFHADILEQHLQPLTEKMNSMIKILESKAKDKKPIDLITLFKPCFLDISLRSTTNVDINSLEQPNKYPYLDAIERMSEIVMARLFSPLLKINIIFNLSSLKKAEVISIETIKNFIKKIVSEREAKLSEDTYEGKKRTVVADSLIELRKRHVEYPLDEINAHVSNNIFASYDTLSTTASYLIFLLANNPSIQDEVYNEINTFCPDILTNGISMKEINNLKLLDRCVKESLRMFPPAPIIGRKIQNEIITKQGKIPAGVDVYINLYSYHRNSDVYPKPDCFNPDRFLPENLSTRHPLSWIPFGMGVRMCIGQKQALMQSKASVAMVLKKFIIKPYETPSDLKLIANLVLKSRDGIRVYLQSRDNA